MLAHADVAQLVADDLRSTCLAVDVGVAMTIYPVVDSATLDECVKIGGEGCPQGTELVHV